jgi:predicted DCC family thiol-disulfide oxidoreductase YuxK
MMSNVNESQFQVNPTGPGPSAQEGAVILFDGECNLCNAWVNFVIDRDPDSYFKFSASQAEAAQPILENYGITDDAVNTVFLIEDGFLHRRSDAALRIARRLTFPWPLLFGLVFIPRFLRDPVYNLIAKNRYRWFGKREKCRVPTPELESRFLR